MDLPIEGGAASFDTHADVICSALDGCDGDVVVGHSYGGVVIPLVAARRPVRHLVYVGACVPDIGRSLAHQLRDEPDMFNPAALALRQHPSVFADRIPSGSMYFGGLQ